jgi:hypothetical protein
MGIYLKESSADTSFIGKLKGGPSMSDTACAKKVREINFRFGTLSGFTTDAVIAEMGVRRRTTPFDVDREPLHPMH